MPRFKLTIEYDGLPYRGFQRQDGLPTVQQALEEAIATFNQKPVTIFVAGRTDTGVHATGQVVHVDLDGEWKAEKVFEATNGLLKLHGETVVVTACEAVPEDFDARFSATARHYLYRISNRFAPTALDRERVWHVRHPLDEKAMDDAAQVLVGHHDFTTFRSTQCQAKSPLRTLDSLDVTRTGDEIRITTKSRAFLHNQVRSMVGALKMVGDGRWSKADLKASLDARDRKACAAVAPAHGLYLTQVDY